MSLKKYDETHSLLQEYFFKDIASYQQVKLKKLEQIENCKTQDHCLLNDGHLDIAINNEMLDDKITHVAMKLVFNEIEFMKDDIKIIICKLDPNKVHGHVMISMRMLKMSGHAIKEPLFKTSKTIVQSLFFQSAAILLPIFERIMYGNTLKYFLENNLISSKQCGFRSGESCANQLLSITHYVLLLLMLA